ncbi:MAG: GTPase HflX [Lentisphaerae bacterium]|nr:GTPase HflX [Lentisphaerota bacterium]MBT5610053.1 GTPase HflX [Lentisphaerota bacterium]MBT7055547.1 GTPase HflX [Lentisphaerota bacterium]MBT7841498.1 GTPase HflX [Lentisphaerota bacterium]
MSQHHQDMQETAKPGATAFLVGVRLPGMEDDEVADLLNELDELSQTWGLKVVGQTTVRVRKPQAQLLVGSGQATDISGQAQACGADVIVFDEVLSPSQQRNWERVGKSAVIDRQEVILGIFASRAQTREASLQVALAQAHYELPRLKRRWTHLSRQRGMRGGMGLRGEGEQQIEVDARLVKTRIVRLQEQLNVVSSQRAVQRSRRLRRPIPVAAIVGYTNAGKSSLLNALTEAQVLTEDKLFATLDPTVRRVSLPNRQELLLGDTVGFIRKLPHLLIQAFKATLEETAMADFLIEVVDASSPHTDDHHQTTRRVLGELGAGDKHVMTVLNKIDLLPDPIARRRLQRHFPGSVLVSARTGEGLEELVEALADELGRMLRTIDLFIPHSRYDVVAKLHRTSRIVSERHEDDGIAISAAVPHDVLPSVENFLSQNDVTC